MPMDSLIQTIHQVVKQPSLSQVIILFIELCFLLLIFIVIIAKKLTPFLGRATRYSNQY